MITPVQPLRDGKVRPYDQLQRRIQPSLGPGGGNSELRAPMGAEDSTGIDLLEAVVGERAAAD